jgi:hypothetical protein
LFPQKLLSVQFLLLLDFTAYKKELVILFGYSPKYIGNKKKLFKKIIGFCRRKLNKGKLDQMNSELA